MKTRQLLTNATILALLSSPTSAATVDIPINIDASQYVEMGSISALTVPLPEIFLDSTVDALHVRFANVNQLNVTRGDSWWSVGLGWDVGGKIFDPPPENTVTLTNENGQPFYVFPNIEGTGKPSKELESFLMEKAGVAVLSGTTFGSRSEGFVRVSYANSQDAIRRAIEKIDAALHGS